jgi:putative spermidine/putrescine transport system ATP-binding protein
MTAANAAREEGQAGPAPGTGHVAGHVDVSRVWKRFGSSTILSDLSISVAQGEFVSLLGPSGCGKTTLLRIIAGLLAPDTGTISIAGRDLTRVAAHKRNIGVVFQSYALFPHLTVADNVAFGLQARGVPRAETARRVAEALSLVRMEAYADRGVASLSGGQQQRIAVARSLAVKPALLLLDEPFSALDRKLRETMQIELRRLLRDLGITSIFVTHDQDEALVMSDRIAVMNEGRIEHLGTAGEVYGRPKSLFVLEFVGQSTRLRGTATRSSGGLVEVDTASGRVRAPGSFRPGSPVVVAARPETIMLGEGPESEYNNIRATLTDVVYLGSKSQLLMRGAGADDVIQIEMSRPPPGILSPGSILLTVATLIVCDRLVGLRRMAAI